MNFWWEMTNGKRILKLKCWSLRFPKETKYKLPETAPMDFNSEMTQHQDSAGQWRHVDGQDRSALWISSKLAPASLSLCDNLPRIHGHWQGCWKLLRHWPSFWMVSAEVLLFYLQSSLQQVLFCGMVPRRWPSRSRTNSQQPRQCPTEVVESLCDFWMVSAEALALNLQDSLQQFLLCVMVSQGSMGVGEVLESCCDLWMVSAKVQQFLLCVMVSQGSMGVGEVLESCCDILMLGQVFCCSRPKSLAFAAWPVRPCMHWSNA